MDYIKRIQNIGLKKPEAEIYLACLRLGVAKVSELAKEVDAPRTSIYGHIKTLINKGYIKKSKKQSIEYFSPTKPNTIKEDLEEKLSNFSAAVPQLENLLDSIINLRKSLIIVKMELQNE